jgi:PDZ domain-containing secreted protein
LNKIQKYIITLSILVIVLLGFNIFNEPFPVKKVNKEEVLKKVNQADGKMVKIPSNHQGYQWYISINEKADENLIKLMRSFVKKKSNLYFFESVQGNIIVKSVVWKESYTIFRFPEGI